MRICKIKGCNNKCFCKDLCKKCYYKQYRQDNKKHLLKYSKKWNKNNPEYFKQWQKNNPKHSKQYYLDNKEKMNKQSKQYKKNNNMLKYQKKYKENNKEKIIKYSKKYMKQYYKTPKGKAIIKTHSANRRVLTKDLTIEIIQKVYEDNIKKYGVLTCYLCGEPIVEGDKELKDSLEHSIPVTRDGNNEIENLGIAHLICNIKKHTMTLDEWFILKARERGNSCGR